MRFVRSALTLSVLLLAIPSWGKQTSHTASTVQTPSDPQAVAIVQAAITALGGATAISQPQSWTFQAQMQGPRANGNISYSISTDTDTGHYVLADGTIRTAPAIHSYFVPALIAPILLKESQDPDFSMHYMGLSTLDSEPVTVVAFSDGPTQFPSQVWYFDANNLPAKIDFRLPAEIGARAAVNGPVLLSDYRAVAGVLYPFRIISIVHSQIPQILILQSLTPSLIATSNEFNGPGGDLR